MKSIQVDLKAKKSEHEWQSTLDKFWLLATPKWFTWIGWVIVLGILKYVNQRTENIAISIVHGASYIFFIMYFIAFFYQFSFINVPFIKSKKLSIFISILLSGSLGFGVLVLLHSIIDELAKSGG